MTNEVEKILELFSKNYEKISVKVNATSDNIHQNIIEVNNRDEKTAKLIELLKSDDFKKTIIFMRTKRGVQKLDDQLYEMGFKTVSLHGNKSQPQRKRALEAFKSHKADILIATDVAARGLDVKDVSHVINFDMPETYEDYTHRIGRTGRANKIGYALTFVEKY
jgi:superfamily II DNA/RNA helicase